ncbi:glycosyltransferase family 2 protein [Nocardioides pantholopis]|uniref:glycosyltransferase family 2 protein n=1 Tax=Nocardioides pantholopis TaxID=2483798 RepID=UPI0013E3542A|nr:glycosyltransferase family 2 protein [Nocardioides pantholopis]
MPSVSAIVLAWRDEPVLEEAVHALLASTADGTGLAGGLDVDVVVVDNGCTSESVRNLADLPGVSVVDPGENLGFAAGCNRGARTARGEYLAFVNGDAVVRPDALARMVLAAQAEDVGLVTASVRLYDDPETINSAGNPVHYLGLSWAGGLGEPAAAHARPADVASASGAATVCRADRFAALDGFCEPMFAYCEDTELSLRSWQQGWRVVYEPTAVVTHRYEFSRNPQKLYLVERNRLILVLTVFPRRLLAVVAAPLLALEVAMLAMSARDGWWRQKVAGWRWLLANAGTLRERRRWVQAQRRDDHGFTGLLTGDVTPGVDGLSIPPVLRRLSVAFWSLARRTVREVSP